MSIPLAIFLYVYYAFLLVWLIFCIIAVYHILKYGFKNIVTVSTTFIFIIVASIMVIVSMTFIANIEWGYQIEFMQLFNSDNNPIFRQ